MRITASAFFPLYVRFGIKSGVACLAAYAISYAVGAHYAIWAVVSALVAMQVNVAESVQAGVNRIAGTLIGAAVGVLLLLTLPEGMAYMATAVFGIASLGGFLSRYGARYTAATMAAVIVLLSGASLAPKGYEEAVTFGLMRLLEIAIGVGSAFLISFAVWPVRLVDTLRTDISSQFRECARLLDEVAQSFITRQHYVSTDPLNALEARVWSNHERLVKARKHESLLFGYEHGIMEVQVSALDRTVECLRTMTEALNDYQEESWPLPISHEMRSLADAIMAALRQLGSDTPAQPVPDLIRGLTFGVDHAETHLAELRLQGVTRELPLHKLLQFFTFYQAMRLLSERLLLAFDRLQRFKRG